MKVLIISYSFPPSTSAAANVMYNVCKFLPRNCYTVIAAKKELSNLSRGYDREFELDCSTLRLSVGADRTFDRLKFSFFTILKGLLLNKEGGIDCILAVYPNESSLIGAYILHKLLRKPLAIYMHDLWSEVASALAKKSEVKYAFLGFLERRILSAASKILVMNEMFEKHYSRKGFRNLVVFPPCIDLDHYQGRPVKAVQSSRNNLMIAFTGSVYGANESAILALLKATETIGNVEVVFATSQQKEYLKRVSVGFLSKRECFDLQANADVLFLPLSHDSPYPEEVKCVIPCKVLEYLAAGKPVLGIVPKGSFMEGFIKRHQVGIAVTELSTEKIVEAINELRDERKWDKLSQNALRTARLFDARVRTKQLRSLLNNIVLNCKSKS
jgi:glycosyltransferase involved in cell wall biosynthesis